MSSIPQNLNDSEKESQPQKIEEIEKELLEIPQFKGLSKDARKAVVARTLTIVERRSHSGPLPDIETLEGYARLIPNGADRIMTAFEKQVDHRMSIERKVINTQLAQSIIGQVFGLTIGLAVLWYAYHAIIVGHDWAGTIVGVGGITGLVSAFIKGRQSQEKDLEEKRPRTIKKSS